MKFQALMRINQPLKINENFSEGIELRKKILELTRKEIKAEFILDKCVIY